MGRERRGKTVLITCRESVMQPPGNRAVRLCAIALAELGNYFAK